MTKPKTRREQAEAAASKKAAQKGILNPYNPESRHSYDCYKEGFNDAVQWADSTPPPQEGDEEAALKKYMQINDFESALRTRPDKGAIYTNEIIIGWIEDTFKYARRAQNAEVERLKDELQATQKAYKSLAPIVTNNAMNYRRQNNPTPEQEVLIRDRIKRETQELRALLERAMYLISDVAKVGAEPCSESVACKKNGCLFAAWLSAYAALTHQEPENKEGG